MRALLVGLPALILAACSESSAEWVESGDNLPAQDFSVEWAKDTPDGCLANIRVHNPSDVNLKLVNVLWTAYDADGKPIGGRSENYPEVAAGDTRTTEIHILGRCAEVANFEVRGNGIGNSAYIPLTFGKDNPFPVHLEGCKIRGEC